MFLLINKLFKIRIWSRIDELNTFGPSKSEVAILNAKTLTIHVRAQSCTKIGATQFLSCPLRRTVHWVKQKKEISVQVFSQTFQTMVTQDFWLGYQQLYLQCSQNELEFFSGNNLSSPEMSNFNVLCSCDGFDWGGNLSCTWVITENWSICAI